MKIATFALFAVAAVASAKSYTVTLLEPAALGKVELAPGQYKVEVNGGTAVISKGKSHTEAQVNVENVERKFDQTTVRLDTSSSKPKIQEIRLGGTKTKLVFND